MQKLLYYAQAWHLVNYGSPLFEDEIQAWDFGPVIPRVYNKYKKYGSSQIEYVVSGQEEKHFSEEQLEYLTEFFNVFSNFSATALVSMSHNEDPWKNAFQRKQYSAIDIGEMTSYYTKLYEEKNNRKG